MQKQIQISTNQNLTSGNHDIFCFSMVASSTIKQHDIYVLVNSFSK